MFEEDARALSIAFTFKQANPDVKLRTPRAISNVRGARCVGNAKPRRRSQLTAFLPLILLIQGYGNDHAGGERSRRRRRRRRS